MKHNVIVDWVRGLSVLVVICLHTDAFFPSVIEHLGGVAGNGYFGVTAFFCTSGFLITTNMLRRYDQVAKVDLYAFYVMRFGRIAPPLILLCALLSYLSTTSLQNFILPPSNSLKTLLLSILKLRYNHYYQHVDQVLSWAILWSLSIEETFYLGYPIIAKVTRNAQCLVALLLGLIAYAIMHRLGGPLTVYDYFGCFDAIAFGVLAALAAKYCRAEMTRLAAWAFMIVGSSMAVYTYLRIGLGGELYNAGLILIALGTGLVLFASQCAPFVTMRLWPYDPLAYCGQLSYEIYLFHITIFSLLTPLFGPRATQYPLSILALILFCIVAASACIHRFYSEPLNRWLRARLLVRQARVTEPTAVGLLLPNEQPAVSILPQ